MAPAVKNLLANAGNVRDVGSIPGLGICPRGGRGNPLQYSYLENLTDREAWWATVHTVAQSQRQLKRQHAHACIQLNFLQQGYLYKARVSKEASGSFLKFGIPQIEEEWGLTSKAKSHQVMCKQHQIYQTSPKINSVLFTIFLLLPWPSVYVFFTADFPGMYKTLKYLLSKWMEFESSYFMDSQACLHL